MGRIQLFNLKRLFSFTFLLIAFNACNKFDDSLIWDKLDNHEARLEQLEIRCLQMNSNIESIKTIVEAIQNNDYVTSVQPLVENSIVIGYSITFSNSGNIVIYHGINGADGKDGVDGKDGENGKAAHTPVIGVILEMDGIYYWTIDGELLLDADGNKVQAAGADGVSPQLKIDNAYWYVSYDNGQTWDALCTSVGEDGDSLFDEVTYDEHYVYIKLIDGSEITIPTKELIEEQQSITSEVRLAKQYDLVVGDTFQLFYSGVVKTFNVKNEGIRVVCEVGKQFGRYYEYTPNDSDSGNAYKLSLTTRRFDGSIISYGETMLVVHPKLTNDTTPSVLNILIFGDSLTSSGQWASEGLRRIYGSDTNILPISLGLTNECITYGTKKSVNNGYTVYHEGYGGWNWDYFLNKKSKQSPFYNSTVDDVDFKYHAEKFGNPGADLVAILLTWNTGGIKGDFEFSSSINRHMTSAAELLRYIHNDLPEAKVICLGIQISSLNGGTGESYGATGGYSDPYATAFYAFDYNKALEELVTNEEFGQYCYYADTKGQFDSEYNMPFNQVPVNNRNESETEIIGSNGVHPSIEGYYQIGDAFYRALHRVLPQMSIAQ